VGAKDKGKDKKSPTANGSDGGGKRRAADAVGSSKRPGSSTSDDLGLDGFDIQEATERITLPEGERRPARGKRDGHPGGKRKSDRGIVSGPASCEEAFEAVAVKPRWRARDEVEVAWKGKGFEGAWAVAEVILLEGPDHAMVRFAEFVDEDGSKLCERMGIERLRPAAGLEFAPPLAPPPAPSPPPPRLPARAAGCRPRR
jgi:hypothetical protein